MRSLTKVAPGAIDLVFAVPVLGIALFLFILAAAAVVPASTVTAAATVTGVVVCSVFL